MPEIHPICSAVGGWGKSGVAKWALLGTVFPSGWLVEAEAICLNSLYGSYVFAFWLWSSLSTISSLDSLWGMLLSNTQGPPSRRKGATSFPCSLLSSLYGGKSPLFVWTDTFLNIPLWSKKHKASSRCIFRNVAMVTVSRLGICRVVISACRWDSSNSHIAPCWRRACDCYQQPCYLFYDFTIIGQSIGLPKTPFPPLVKWGCRVDWESLWALTSCLIDVTPVMKKLTSSRAANRFLMYRSQKQFDGNRSYS